MTPAARALTWRPALVFGALALFWASYWLVQDYAYPVPDVSAYRLQTGGAAMTAPPSAIPPAELALYAAGIEQPAIVEIDRERRAMLHPYRATWLDLRPETDSVPGREIACLSPPCPPSSQFLLGPLKDLTAKAARDRFVQVEAPRITALSTLIVGVLMLMLLPISRFSRVQLYAGGLFVTIGVNAWIEAFGKEAIPPDWYLLVRYAEQYLLLLFAALSLNAFAGWDARLARVSGVIYASFVAALIAAQAMGGRIGDIYPALDIAGLALVAAAGVKSLSGLSGIASGPATRAAAILAIGITSVAFDIIAYLVWNARGSLLQATSLSPLFLAAGIAVELAFQGYRLNQEAMHARDDLERELLERDANLLRSSSLLRHRERSLAVDAERRRLLRDMHDGAGGLLTHLLLQVRRGALSHHEIAAELQSAVDDLRNIATAIDNDAEPIDQALALLRERLAPRAQSAGVELVYMVDCEGAAPVIDARRLLQLYRIVQEAVTNSLRHGGASAIALRLATASDGQVEIAVEDDGHGFDAAQPAAAAAEGRGLANMRQRARLIGAELTIDAATGGGARILVRFAA